MFITISNIIVIVIMYHSWELMDTIIDINLSTVFIDLAPHWLQINLIIYLDLDSTLLLRWPLGCGCFREVIVNLNCATFHGQVDRSYRSIGMRLFIGHFKEVRTDIPHSIIDYLCLFVNSDQMLSCHRDYIRIQHLD